MPLNKARLRQKIEAALTVDKDNPERRLANVAADLADAIEEFVKGGDVVEITVTVNTTGSATAQTGIGTQTGTGKIQ